MAEVPEIRPDDGASVVVGGVTTHPRSTGKRCAGRCALRGAGDEPAGERDDWSNVVNPAPYLDPKGRGNNSMVRKGR